MKLTTLLVTFGLLASSQAHADLIYQSATPVVTSTTGDSSENGTVASSNFFSAVDFQLTTTTQITAIGGHFGVDGVGNNELFGAIVAVSSLTAAPADPTLSTGVLASTLVTLPGFSATDTLTGSLNVVLGPGYYAVVFGSGLFGATGAGFLVDNVTSPTYTGPVNTNGVITYTLRQSDGNQSFHTPGGRLFVLGGAVPEPSSAALAATGLLLGLGCHARRRKVASR